MTTARPAELGELLERHRPVPLWLAWLLVLLLAVSIAVPVGASAGAIWGVSAAALLVPLWAVVWRRPLFLEHRMHEHGLRLDSSLPGGTAYTIPHHTIDSHDIQASHRRPTDPWPAGEENRLRRTAPFLGHLAFPGLAPEAAARLSRGQLRWQDAAALTSPAQDTGTGTPGSDAGGTVEEAAGRVLAPRTRWLIGLHRPERHRADLRDLVNRDRSGNPLAAPPQPGEDLREPPTPEKAGPQWRAGLRTALVAGLQIGVLTAFAAAGLLTERAALPPGGIGVLLVLGGHLLASGFRVLTSVLLTIPGGVLLYTAAPLAAGDTEGLPMAALLIAAGCGLVIVTVAWCRRLSDELRDPHYFFGVKIWRPW